MQGKKLRELLQQERGLALPGAYNPFAAKQIAAMGFPGVYVSGAGLANSLGVPDDGTLGLDDFAYMGGWIARAVDIPVISDADTGFGDVARTVERYAAAGLAGMHIEDQVFPKRCGHLSGKEVVPAAAMAGLIGEARAARDRCAPDFVIIARTDARGAANVAEERQLEESIARGRLYREAGADMIFPESLRTREEFARYRSGVPGWLFANMTEFGQTPFITAAEFAALGYSIVIFPVSLFRFHAGQTDTFLSRLKADGNQARLTPEMLPRSTINNLLNYKP